MILGYRRSILCASKHMDKYPFSPARVGRASWHFQLLPFKQGIVEVGILPFELANNIKLNSLSLQKIFSSVMCLECLHGAFSCYKLQSKSTGQVLPLKVPNQLVLYTLPEIQGVRINATKLTRDQIVSPPLACREPAGETAPCGRYSEGC